MSSIEIVTGLSAGVAAGAVVPAPEDTSERSVRESHHCVDLNLGAERQGRNPDRDASGRLGFEEGRVDLVHQRELRYVGHIHGHPHCITQGSACRVAHGSEVLEATAGLLCGGVAGQLAGLRIQRNLTGAEQEAACTDGMGIRTDRRRGVWCGYQLTMRGH
jgi:hypothetical protein